MDITRRGLFRLLAGAAVVPVAEQVSRSFFFAPVGGWKSDWIVNPNQFLTNQMITNAALRILMNNLKRHDYSRCYDESFAVKGARIGDTLNIRKPQRFVIG